MPFVQDRRVPVLTALLAPAVLAGCSTYSSPTLSVLQARVKERTPEALVLDIAIDATNRNHIELPLREVQYTLRVDGREVFRGTRSPEASLRRLSIQTLHIPAVIPLADAESLKADAGASRYTIDGVLRYTTPGQLAQVLFDIKVRRPSVRFSGEGEVDLSVPVTTPTPAPSVPQPLPPGPGN